MKIQIFCEESIEPRCAHFGTCGGCRFQHIPYDEQLTQKERFVQELFESPVRPIIGCEPEWRYRNKMEFSFSQNKSGEKFLGLMMRGKRGRVVDLQECWLTNGWFTEVLERVRQWWQESSLEAYFPPANRGTLRTLTLREGVYTQEKMAILTFSNGIDEGAVAEFLASLPPLDSVILREQITQKKTPTRFQETPLAGNEHIHEKLHDAEGKAWLFKIRPASFFQPNTFQAERLYQHVLELGGIDGEEVLFDLYCGTGSIGIFASQRAKKVWGIEQVPEAVHDGRENVIENGVENMEILEGDVGEVFQKIPEKPSCVIVDPPRAGLCSKTLEHLKRCLPQKILYISCNPATQAANCKELFDAGYHIETLQPIDQFPHTPHIENIASLRLE